MPASKKSSSHPSTDLSFEEAIAELELVVEAMEGEQLPLEELISRYEKAASLLKHAHSILHGVRKRINLITLTDQESEKAPESKSGKSEDENDITLF